MRNDEKGLSLCFVLGSRSECNKTRWEEAVRWREGLIRVTSLSALASFFFLDVGDNSTTRECSAVKSQPKVAGSVPMKR